MTEKRPKWCNGGQNISSLYFGMYYPPSLTHTTGRLIGMIATEVSVKILPEVGKIQNQFYPFPEKILSISLPEKKLWAICQVVVLTNFILKMFFFCLYLARFRPHDAFCCYNLGSKGRIKLFCSTISITGKIIGQNKIDSFHLRNLIRNGTFR